MTGYPFPAGPNGPTARTRQVAIRDRERLRGIRSGRLEGNGNPAARDPHVARDQRHQARQLRRGHDHKAAWMGEAIPSAVAVAAAAAIRAPTDAAAQPVSMQPVLGDWPTRRAGRCARRGRCGRRQGAAHAAPFVRVTPARRLPGRSATAATRRSGGHRDQHEQRIRERFPRPGRSRSPSRRGLPERASAVPGRTPGCVRLSRRRRRESSARRRRSRPGNDEQATAEPRRQLVRLWQRCQRVLEPRPGRMEDGEQPDGQREYGDSGGDRPPRHQTRDRRHGPV
jgi:hypothetical protein